MPSKRFIRGSLFLTLLAILVGQAVASSTKSTVNSSVTPGVSGFSVKVRDLEIHHPEFSVFVLPGESIPVGVSAASGDIQLQASGGKIEGQLGDWTWTAPATEGAYDLNLKVATLDAFRLRAFVMRPASAISDDALDGYMIGEYPDEPLNDLDVYLPPRGFVQLVDDTSDLPVSPHFRLGQFRCKQEGSEPAYVVLHEKLLLKLELILEKLQDRGIEAETLHVMSGYRTPEYNDNIGNGRYSRHIYGDAADIFVDQNPRDGVMDDLNGDGRIDREDARWLARLIDEIDTDPVYEHLVGGMGTYNSNDYHGPFVHVDVRGFTARWNP